MTQIIPGMLPAEHQRGSNAVPRCNTESGFSVQFDKPNQDSDQGVHMKRAILAIVALIALLPVSQIARADLTYAIVNYPADQSGATLSGNIKTDGTIGALVSSN